MTVVMNRMRKNLSNYSIGFQRTVRWWTNYLRLYRLYNSCGVVVAHLECLNAFPERQLTCHNKKIHKIPDFLCSKNCRKQTECRALQVTKISEFWSFFSIFRAEKFKTNVVYWPNLRSVIWRGFLKTLFEWVNL